MCRFFLVCQNYILNFFKVQVIVTLVSFPILTNWGIPLSVMSFLGNLLFSPILTIFLVISSLIFVTELLSIPNGFLIHGLTLTTSFWEHTLTFGKKSWLIGFAQPQTILTILLIILTSLFLMRFVFRMLSKAILVALITVSLFAVLEYNRQQSTHKHTTAKTVPYTNKKLTISVLPNKKIQITDNGLFNKKQSPEKFVNFELKPYVIKTYGTTSIEKVILHKPSSRSFLAIRELSQTFTIKTVSIAYFKKSLSRYGWRTYFLLKEKLEKDGTKLTRF